MAIVLDRILFATILTKLVPPSIHTTAKVLQFKACASRFREVGKYQGLRKINFSFECVTPVFTRVVFMRSMQELCYNSNMFFFVLVSPTQAENVLKFVANSYMTACQDCGQVLLPFQMREWNVGRFAAAPFFTSVLFS